jgi:hypothetical protein
MDCIEQGPVFIEEGPVPDAQCSDTLSEPPTTDYSLDPRTVRLDTKPPRPRWWLLGLTAVLGSALTVLALKPLVSHPRLDHPEYTHRHRLARPLHLPPTPRVGASVHIRKQTTRSHRHLRILNPSIGAYHHADNVSHRPAPNIGTDVEGEEPMAVPQEVYSPPPPHREPMTSGNSDFSYLGR